MIYGLSVQASAERPEWARLEVQLPWPSPPPVGVEWRCCWKDRVGAATVTGATWAGLGEVDVWVMMTAPRSLVHHLANEHGFSLHLV